MRVGLSIALACAMLFASADIPADAKRDKNNQGLHNRAQKIQNRAVRQSIVANPNFAHRVRKFQKRAVNRSIAANSNRAQRLQERAIKQNRAINRSIAANQYYSNRARKFERRATNRSIARRQNRGLNQSVLRSPGVFDPSAFVNQIANLRLEIQARLASGQMSPGQAAYFQSQLDQLAAQEAQFRASGGGLTAHEGSILNNALSNLRVTMGRRF
jgi:hypothetical protein